MIYVICSLISSLLFSLQPVVMKEINMSVLYQVLICFVATVIPPVIYFMYYGKIPFNKILNNPTKIRASVYTWIFAITLLFGFKILPMSISLPLFLLYPMFTNIASKIINKTKYKVGAIISNIITFIGVCIITFSRTYASHKTIITGSIFVLISAISFALSLVYVDKYESNPEEIEYKKDKTTFFNVNYEMLTTYIIGTFITGILAVVYYANLGGFGKFMDNFMGHKKTSVGLSTILKIFVGFFIVNYVANTFNFYALNNLRIIIFSALQYVQIIIAMIIGYFLLNEEMGPRKFIGSFVIIVGVVLSFVLSKNNNKENTPKHVQS